MILKASERGGGKQLALHLLNTHDNEHVEVHELRGFVSDDLTGAMKEAYAVSKGTRAKNFLFSVSLNPPEREDVPVQVFEDVIERIEQANGLDGHARAVVFHEKEGRRHAHAVWSRIDTQTMTAKNLSHYKRKLQDISRELYHEHDWKMPAGLVRGGQSDPRNFTLDQWQQAKRMGKNARDLNAEFQDAWAMSDNATTFGHALSERGFILAKGDRRGHVAVSHEGEVLSIARTIGKKAKEVRAKLGEPGTLPSVDDAKTQMARDMRGAFLRHAKEAKIARDAAMEKLNVERQATALQHRTERQRLDEGQKTRQLAETKARSAKLNSGLKGLWQRLSGQRAAIQKENEREAYAAIVRDREQRDLLISQQMADRRQLQDRIKALREEHKATLRDIRADQTRFGQVEPEAQKPAPTVTSTADRKSQQQAAFENARIWRESPQDRLARLRNGPTPHVKHADRGPEIER
ncbi:MAG: relaxase/mobilization nuclease domain-containing protein [Hyphomicrobiales bacterium]